MNLNRYRKSLSGFFPVACAILLAASLFANSLNQLQEKPYSLRVPVELVLVPVTVEDGDGKLIAGLQKEDFQLFEEGVPQTITYFSSDPVPLSAVIMIDRSTDAGTQSLLKETLLSLIESFSPFDEVAVFQFEHTTDKVQDFTSNKDELLKAFDKSHFEGGGSRIWGRPFRRNRRPVLIRHYGQWYPAGNRPRQSPASKNPQHAYSRCGIHRRASDTRARSQSPWQYHSDFKRTERSWQSQFL